MLLTACGSTHSGEEPGTSTDASASDAIPSFTNDDSGTTGVFTSSDTGAALAPISDAAVALPSNFVKTEFGGYALGPAIEGDGADAGVAENTTSANCNLVVGVVRDFKNQADDNGTGHPDFGVFMGASPTTGLVNNGLGTDLKPVFAGNCDSDTTYPAGACPNGQQLTTQANFDQWYRYTANVNKPFLVYLQFVPNAGVYTFQSDLYFPLDNAGWGNNATGDDGKQHNFGFTTELHLKFTYQGGEHFTFIGDDDVWVFINNQLAVDLGGLHQPATGTIAVDSLGLTKGMEYSLDLFNAERRPTGSHFRADTNLAFTSCGTIPPDIPH
jgi:fibro-slime domain-containing protein